MGEARVPGAALTPQMLKSRTGEFDLESISFLDLSNMGFRDVSCVGDCLGLLHLDLSNNRVSNLGQLVDLKLLETLNLSCNNLSSLDGVEELVNLSSLNVAGNMIRSLHCLSGLVKLEKLQTLRLQDAIHNLSNPVCISEKSYKKAMCNLLPNLKTLDGERVSGLGSNFYEMCDELDTILEDQDLHSEQGLALKSFPWNTDKLFSSNKTVDRGVQEAEKGFRDVMLQCNKANEDAEKAIQDATVALWSAS